MSISRIFTREPDLTKLRDLPRAEAIRIAIIKYTWDAAEAAEKVDNEQGHHTKGPLYGALVGHLGKAESHVRLRWG